MAKPRIALSELLEMGSDTDLLREMIQHVVQRVMDMDVENICAAAYGERSPERQNSRNGYRKRLWDIRAGAVNVKIPKLRQGSYFPPFLEPRRTAEKALAAVIQEAYVQGVSTRSVDELVKAMGMTGISKSQVSRLCAEIDERVNAFFDRPIEGEGTGDRRDVREVSGGRTHRLQGRHNCRRREHRGRARSARDGGQSVGSRDVLERLPALSDSSRAAGSEARDLRRPRRPQSRRGQGSGRHLAALQSALPAQCAGPRR